jgi:hypothetical protein
MREQRYDNADVVELALSILAEEMRLWTLPVSRTHGDETAQESSEDQS